MPDILTDGHGLYVRARRGVYRRVSRRGVPMGATCTDFKPRPRWKPARPCAYDERVTLTCRNCGSYDMRYAETGQRSYCLNQGKGWE